MADPLRIDRERFPFVLYQGKVPIVAVYSNEWLVTFENLPLILEDYIRLGGRATGGAWLPKPKPDPPETRPNKASQVGSHKAPCKEAIGPVSLGDLVSAKRSGNQYTVEKIEGDMITISWTGGKELRKISMEALSRHYERC